MKKTDPRISATGSYWSLANYVGQGFQVYGAYNFDSTVGNLFHYPDNQVHEFTFQGIKVEIPDAMTGTENAKSDTSETYGSTREEYQNKLAVSADVEVGIGAFSGSISSSFSSSYDNTVEYAFHRFVYHSELCFLELRPDATGLEPGFQKAIDGLPATVGPGDLQKFSEFFERYGTHFIWRVTYGGSLEMCTTVKKSTLLTEHDVSVAANAQYASICKVGVKVDNSDKYQKFENNSTTKIRAAGGNQTLAAGLVGRPPEPSQETVDDYTAWIASISNDPSPTAFKLKGIWSLCGDKESVVRLAWDEYRQVMHPKLEIVTEHSLTPPIVTLGRRLKPTNPFQPSKLGGWQIVLLDRKDILTDSGIKFDRTYSFADSGSHTGIVETYETMHAEIMEAVERSKMDSGALLLLAVSYNLRQNWGPIGDFYELLFTSGGSVENLRKVKAWDVGSGNSARIEYLLIGALDSGVGAGVDYAHGNWEAAYSVMGYQAAFYRSRANGPYAASLISAGPK